MLDKIETELDNYYQEHYSNLKGYEKGSIKYLPKEKKYQITYTNNEEKELYFTLTYQKNNITSNYEDNIVKGKIILDTREEEIKQALNKILNNTYFEVEDVLFDELDSYSDSEIVDIISKNNIEAKPFYQLVLRTKISLKNIDQQLNNLTFLLESQNFNPKSIMITNTQSGEEKIELKKGDNEIWTIAYSAKS